jgi:hypothetical protein
MEKNIVLETLGGEASLSDLKGIGEALMAEAEINNYHLALIRARNYAVIGGKQFTFMNNTGVADLFENMRNNKVTRDKLLADTAVAIASFEGKSYFDHAKFSEKVKKHARAKR